MADWVCGRCHSINRERASTCYSCGASRGTAETSMEVAQSAADPAVPMLATPDGQTLAAPAVEPILSGTAGLVGGLVGGALAAVGATVLWYAVVAFTGWQIGLVAIAVGWLVGQGVVLGSQRQTSIPLVAASFALTLLALTVSEYLIVYHFVAQELGAANVIDVVQPPAFVIEIVIESITADPLTLAFWAIALFQAVVIPFRALTHRPA